MPTPSVIKAWYANEVVPQTLVPRTALRQRLRENTPPLTPPMAPKKNITVGPCSFLSLTISRKRCHQGKHFKYIMYCISFYLPCQYKVTHIYDKAPLDSSAS